MTWTRGRQKCARSMTMTMTMTLTTTTSTRATTNARRRRYASTTPAVGGAAARVVGNRGASLGSRGGARTRASGAGEEEETDATSTTTTSSSSNGEVRLDPFGFGARRQDEPDKIMPGFDTAEGGKVGPVGTAAISLLLVALFGGSFFFTSVPRESVMEMAARDLANDPDAPTQTFARR
jgi:hypothetical protein